MDEANPERGEASPSQPIQSGAPGTPGASDPDPTAPDRPGAPGDAGSAPSPYPAYPAYPAMPAYPAYSGSPSMPMYPGYSSPPSTPVYPAYTGPPSAPYPEYPPNPGGYPPYPGAPGAPSTPLAPPYPGYPVYAGMPGGQVPPGSMPLPPAERPAPAKRPLSWLVPALLLAATVLVVAGALALGIVLNGSDWASGAIAGGITALALAGAYLVGTLVRLALGRRTRQVILLGLGAALVLGLLGGTGLVLPTPLHRAQARTLENSDDWSGAIHEYELAGEHAPGSHDVARVYDEWGDQLEMGKRYADAIGEYETVLAIYPNATAEVQRAHNSEARVRFEFGTQLAAQGQYYLAIVEFETITRQFSDTAYAARAHASAAQAYYAFAQANLQAGQCDSALPSYQTLASTYADTPEGAKAKAALAAPVDVTGTIQRSPSSPVALIVYLSRTATQQYISQDYGTVLDSSGGFRFTNVQQGKYDLAVTHPDGTWTYWYETNDPSNLYTVVVGPLCTLDAGIYSY